MEQLSAWAFLQGRQRVLQMAYLELVDATHTEFL
jgi:hypothetical protein